MEDNTVVKYKVVCSECKHEFSAAKSIAQESFGQLHNGSGACPNCDTYLNLTFNEEEQIFISTEWNTYCSRYF